MGSERISRSDFFGDREVTILESKCFVGLLQMQRNRIVNAGIDLGVREMLLQTIAIRYTHNVQVMHWTRP